MAKISNLLMGSEGRSLVSAAEFTFQSPISYATSGQLLVRRQDPGSELTTSTKRESITVRVDDNKVLFGLPDGTIKTLGLTSREQSLLVGNAIPARSISVFNNGAYILTCGEYDKTKDWTRTTAGTLKTEGGLPKLSTEDLKRLGIVQ